MHGAIFVLYMKFILITTIGKFSLFQDIFFSISCTYGQFLQDNGSFVMDTYADWNCKNCLMQFVFPTQPLGYACVFVLICYSATNAFVLEGASKISSICGGNVNDAAVIQVFPSAQMQVVMYHIVRRRALQVSVVIVL